MTRFSPLSTPFFCTSHFPAPIYLLLMLSLPFPIWATTIRTSAQAAYSELTAANYDQAIISYEAMLTSENEHPEFHFNLGIAYFKSFRFSSAQQSFERALLLSIEDPDFQSKAEYNIGVTMFEQARLYADIDTTRTLDYLKDAIKAFENTIELKPDHESALYNLEICKNLQDILLSKLHPPNSETASPENKDGESPENASQSGEPDDKSEDSPTESDPGNSKESTPDMPKPSKDTSQAQNNEKPSTSEKIPGAPGAQRLDTQEALMLLDSIENDEKRITLSELQQPTLKADSDSDANW